jgi:glutamate transport system substrate-binding protein
MKRHLRLVTALTATALLLAAGCGDDDDEPAAPEAAVEDDPELPAGTTQARLAEQGSIRIGTKYDQPGLGNINLETDEPEGFDVEIGKIVAGKLGIEAGDIEWVETVSANREAFIVNDRVDLVIATYTINDERKEQVDFAGPYYVAGQDIMVKADDTTIKSVTDLNGKKVCSATGSTSIKNVVEKAPQADLTTTFDKYSLCAEALADGRVAAVTTDNIILLGLIKDNPGKFKLVKSTFTTEPYGIGVKKGDDAFRDFINDVIEESYENGDWKKAFDATVGGAGETAPTPPKVDRYTSTGAASTGGSSTTSGGSGSGSSSSTTAGGSGSSGSSTTTSVSGSSSSSSSTSSTSTTKP